MPRVRLRRAVLVGLLVAGGASCGLLDPEEPAPDQILFIRDLPRNQDIYRMNADGSDLVNLTRSPNEHQSLDITPDGRTIVFSRDCQIWTMDLDGSNQKMVAGGTCSRVPRLSPDGRLVAYESGNAIHVMGIDGSGTREVSTDLPPVEPSPCGTTPRSQVWPFGWISTSRVAFRRHICQVGTTFYGVDADGSDLAELDFNPETAHLSPDGTQIAFDRIDNVVFDPRTITVMNVDGSNRRALATGWLPGRFSYSRSPWSPDGRQLYYWSDGHHVVDVRSGTSRPLPEPTTDTEFLGWSPQGDRILFIVYERDDESGSFVASDVHVVKADGAGMVNLTRSPPFEREAIWVPRR
jgi:Tol biopolymer transport system component